MVYICILHSVSVGGDAGRWSVPCALEFYQVLIYHASIIYYIYMVYIYST